MWIQERVADKDLSVPKVAGEMNPADLMTKHVSERKKDVYVEMLSTRYEDGRASASLNVQQGSAAGGKIV